MKFIKDYFLEDYLDLCYLHENDSMFDKGFIITYDTLMHQSLEKYLNGDVNIIIDGSKLDKRYFDNKLWYMLENCYITHTVTYANFISYTIRYKRVVNNTSIHLQRKIKIKKLMDMKQSEIVSL